MGEMTFNELYRYVMSHPTYSTDFPIKVNGKSVINA